MSYRLDIDDWEGAINRGPDVVEALATVAENAAMVTVRGAHRPRGQAAAQLRKAADSQRGWDKASAQTWQTARASTIARPIIAGLKAMAAESAKQIEDESQRPAAVWDLLERSVNAVLREHGAEPSSRGAIRVLASCEHYGLLDRDPARHDQDLTAAERRAIRVAVIQNIFDRLKLGGSS